MLSKVIKNIRAKPESVRKGITLSVSLGITAVIGFFWFVSYVNYSSAMLSAKPPAESPSNFLNKMASLIGESYANVRSSIGGVGDTSTSASSSAATSEPEVSKLSEMSDSQAATATTTSMDTASAATSTSTNATASEGNSVDLQDILNTKNTDNQ